MPTDWIDEVVTVPGSVRALPESGGCRALLYSLNDEPILRIGASSIVSAHAIDDLEALARANGTRRIETQGKVETDGLAARLLSARGFMHFGPPSVGFHLAVDRTRQRLVDLGQQLGNRTPAISRASKDKITAIAATVQTEQLLDDFELYGRLAHHGPGGISVTECPVMFDEAGLAGFILVARMVDPTARELMVRWVAPRYRATAMVNLALIVDCLERATSCGVTTAFFTANPERHADTMILARTLGAERYGESIAFARTLD